MYCKNDRCLNVKLPNGKLLLHTTNQSHLVPGVSFLNKFNLFEFAPLGQDLVSVFFFCKESLYYRFTLKPFVQELCWYMYMTLSVC